MQQLIEVGFDSGNRDLTLTVVAIVADDDAATEWLKANRENSESKIVYADSGWFDEYTDDHWYTVPFFADSLHVPGLTKERVIALVDILVEAIELDEDALKDEESEKDKAILQEQIDEEYAIKECLIKVL